MTWRRVTPVLVVVAAMLFCAAGSVAADQPFACTDQSCTFSVPDSYSPVQNNATQVVFQDAVSGGTFAVAAQDGSTFNSLDEAVAGLMQQSSTADGYEADPAGVKSLVVGGNPAQSFAFLRNNDSGTRVMQAVVTSLYHSKLYVLVFSTTPENEATFVSGAEGIFNSWQFT